MNIYVVRYFNDDIKTVTFFGNQADVNKRKKYLTTLLGSDIEQDITVEKIQIGRNKKDFLNMFNEHGLSTLIKIEE